MNRRRNVVGVALVVAAVTMSGCGRSPTPAPTTTIDEKRLPREALDRRDRSNAVMRAEGVPVLPSLPVIETEAETTLPTTEEVAMRAIATIVVAQKAVGVPDRDVVALARKFDVKGSLSPKERSFLETAAPSHEEMNAFGWRFESAHVLLWSIGLVDQLGNPRQPIDPASMLALLRDNSRAQLLAKAKMRTKQEVLDQADLIYRYRWALVDASSNKRPAPAGLNGDVAMERHQALNWLIYHAEQEWDEVSLDT